jgi:hypothetical protein
VLGRRYLHQRRGHRAYIGDQLTGVLQQLWALRRAATEAGQRQADARPRPAVPASGGQAHAAHRHAQPLRRRLPGLQPAAPLLIVQHYRAADGLTLCILACNSCGICGLSHTRGSCKNQRTNDLQLITVLE